MGHPLRWFLPEVTYEDTIRTIEGQFLLRPDAACRRIVEGVLGKALQRYPGVRLHAYDVHVNHLHTLYSGRDGEELVRFRAYVHGNIARAINRLRGRSGPFWSRRGRAIAVVDDAAIIARLRYVVAQGADAGLVASPTQWPGATSTHALITDMIVRATHTSQDALTRNRKRARPRPVAELSETVDFALAPIRPWVDLAPDALRARHVALVEGIEAEHADKDFLGAEAVCALSPRRRPRRFQRTAAPICHASSVAARVRFAEQYRRYRATFIAAAARVRERGGVPLRDVLAEFPVGSFPRPRWHVRPPPDFVVPWTAGLAAPGVH